MAVRPVEAQSGALGAPITPSLHAPEGMDQSWKTGAMVAVDSGSLVEAGDTPADFSFAGVAIGDASGVVGTDSMYVPLLPFGVPIIVSVDDGSGSRLLERPDLYRVMGVRKSLVSGHYYIDPGTTDGVQFRVIGLIDPLGTPAGRALAVRVLAA